VSNEIIQSRLPILTENLVKWGDPNVLITQQDAADFGAAGPAFDCLLIDAPCSGSGLFRRDPEAMQEWSEAAVTLCSQRQQRILADALPALNTDGVLIYSTCSYSIEENEQIVDWLMKHYALESCRLLLAADWNIVETRSSQKEGYGYRFYPDQAEGEGFFLAAFRLVEPVSSSGTGKRTAKITNKEKLTAFQQEQVSTYLRPLEGAQIVLFGEEWRLLPQPVWNLWNEYRSVWRCRKAGVALGSFAGNDLIPAHDLAVSTLLHPDVSRLELDLETALQYLRKLTWTPDSLHKGWTAVTYQQRPLGWIKALPNRINNYYPSHWRILNK
jgi:NOL1/NOP2/fmu family ribosome biogenesis protein